MFRRRFSAIALAASLVVALPGAQPLALCRAPLTAAAGDAWHAHQWPAPSLATAAQRADRGAGRPWRSDISGRRASAALAHTLTIAGAIDIARDGLRSRGRTTPSPARAPPPRLVVR